VTRTTVIELICDMCEGPESEEAPIFTYRFALAGATGRLPVRLLDLHRSCFPDELNRLLLMGRKPE
jgi:hypothetical protein